MVVVDVVVPVVVVVLVVVVVEHLVELHGEVGAIPPATVHQSWEEIHLWPALLSSSSSSS